MSGLREEQQKLVAGIPFPDAGLKAEISSSDLAPSLLERFVLSAAFGGIVGSIPFSTLALGAAFSSGILRKLKRRPVSSNVENPSASDSENVEERSDPAGHGQANPAEQQRSNTLSGIFSQSEERALEAELEELFASSKLRSLSAGSESKRLEADWVEAHLPKAQIEKARQLATHIFGDAERASAWLREPNIATDNKPPVNLLGTAEGFSRVENLLLRIQYGVLA